MNFKELLFKAIEKAINHYVETGNIGKNEIELIKIYAGNYELLSGITNSFLEGSREKFEGIPFKVED